MTKFFALIAFATLTRVAVASDPAAVFTGPSSVNMNLAAEQLLPLHVRAIAALDVDLTVVSSELSHELSSGKILIQAIPAHLSLKEGEEADVNLKVTVKSDAPSLKDKQFSVVAISRGTEIGRAERDVTVNAVYMVKILNGNPFSFDSPDEKLRFAAHSEGLQIVFVNYSSRSCIIHGEGAIKHQDIDQPLSPALRGSDGQAIPDPQRGAYAPPAIFPAAGNNLDGMYTIHGLYHPIRNVILNATE
jgi:hypothetical protein